MKIVEILGQQKLKGNIKISGAKNSAVALIPAAILCDEEVVIENVPNISDTKDLIEIVQKLNGKVETKEDVIKIDTSKIKNITISEKESKKLRASYYFMGALLGKFKKVEMYFPGGCNIGSRPIDFHTKGFEKLGAKIKIEGNKYTFIAEELKGARIYLDFASVGATVNLMLAAVKAKGKTSIVNAAKEPEIVNVANFLNDMGAKINGAGTSEIKIEGVDYLHKGSTEVLPDRIEAGTYVIIGALLGENLVIDNIIPKHISSLISKLKEIGVDLKEESNRLIITAPPKMKSINIKTLVYPGFPTDLGQPMSVLLTQCEGTSIFEETIYENRMGHISYLINMGADISSTRQSAIIKGKTPLKGAVVTATDLRAGAAMVVAGLLAEGKTKILDVEHILRGYEDIINKLKAVGAKIELKEIK